MNELATAGLAVPVAVAPAARAPSPCAHAAPQAMMAPTHPAHRPAMKLLPLLITLAAWGGVLFAPQGTVSRALQVFVFGVLGGVMVFFGAASYWWDSHMQPDKKSAFVLICGLLTLASQGVTLLRAVRDDEV